MSGQQRVGTVDNLPPGKVTGVGRYAVGNAGGALFRGHTRPGLPGLQTSWDGILPAAAAGRLRQLAATDPNPKVRAEADRTLRRAVS